MRILRIVKFRDKLYTMLCKTKKLKCASIGFDFGSEQCILVELVDGSKFQIIIVTTDRMI